MRFRTWRRCQVPSGTPFSIAIWAFSEVGAGTESSG